MVPPPAVEEEPDEYRAFKAVDRKQRRLLVRPVGEPCEWVPYQYLLRIVLDERQTRLALIFTFMGVTISGRNLGQIAEAVADERCDFVQAFDPKHWTYPTALGAGVIDSIEFMMDKPQGETTRKH